MKQQGRTSSFRTAFEALVAAVRRHPRIEVYAAELRGPAHPADLAAAEEEIGRPLPAAMRTFYKAHDGAFLQWGFRGGAYESYTPPFGAPHDGTPPGCINLLPVKHVMSSAWRTESHVNEIDEDHEALLFGAPLHPEPPVPAVCVDNYSRYHHGDMIFGGPEQEPVMVVSTDYGADLDSSDFTSFATYLDLTLSLYGLCRYKYGLGIGWTRGPERVDAWTRRPSLDELLGGLDESVQGTREAGK